MDGDAHSSAAAAAAAAAAARWWGPTAAAVAAPSASTDVMNQLCRVCGEPAAGFHFGAFTCEGCKGGRYWICSLREMFEDQVKCCMKSFFGRTYNNLSSISECKNDGKCVINKKNRTSCKACRLRKCLMVGMSKSGSRYGRRSNWFKIHCLLQEQHQQQQQQQQQQQATGGNSHPALGDTKNSKGAPPIWDSISPFGHHDGKQQSPNTVMDVDNNNTNLGHKNYLDGKSSRMSSGGHMMPVRSLPHMAGSAAGYGSPGEAAAAAALWATRNTLLPIQMSTHPGPIPHLPVPFLASPFLHHHGMAAAVAAASWNSPHTHHSSNVPPAPRNFVLPFVQSVASPKRMASSPATSSSSSAASHSSSLASSPFQPPDGKAGRRDSPELHNNRLKPFSEVESPSPSIHDKSLAMLQSLGPVQEQPIDLSLRGTKHRKKRRRRRRSRNGSVEYSNSSEQSGGDSEEFDGDSEGGSDSSEENGVEEIEGKSNVGENGKGEEDGRKTTSTPLDLTTRT